MVIIADENIPLLLQERLTLNGFEVLSIFNDFRGVNDLRIIELAQSNIDAIILTEDKDFGEWVFAHHIKNLSVVFLRYHFKESNLIFERVLQLFLTNKTNLLNRFTTVTVNKVRTRDLL
jgi:predicted nuclease of predicted toxin-antitoxin system